MREPRSFEQCERGAHAAVCLARRHRPPRARSELWRLRERGRRGGGRSGRLRQRGAAPRRPGAQHRHRGELDCRILSSARCLRLPAGGRDRHDAEWITANTFELAPDARRFENWEFAHSLVLGLGEAARYAASVGVERGGKRARELAALARSELSAIPGLRVLDRGKELAAIVTVDVAGHEAPELVKLLRQKGINTSASLRAYAVIDMDEKRAASALRISPHYYNTEDEIGAVVEVLASLRRKSAAP